MTGLNETSVPFEELLDGEFIATNNIDISEETNDTNEGDINVTEVSPLNDADMKMKFINTTCVNDAVVLVRLFEERDLAPRCQGSRTPGCSIKSDQVTKSTFRTFNWPTMQCSYNDILP